MAASSSFPKIRERPRKMTIKLYLAESELKLSTLITHVDTGQRPLVRLRETLFHPQGGGQRGDRGFIGNGRVLDVRHAENGEVDHLVEDASVYAVGERVEIAVDADHRALSARLHSAGHLIADAVHSLDLNLEAVAGHHWEGEARVEFDVGVAPPCDLADVLEETLRTLIGAALPIAVVGDPFVARAVQIGGFASVPCGGTHLSNTSEIGSITLNGLRIKSGRLRASYAC
jgi:alanyl-tRNA synthetase